MRVDALNILFEDERLIAVDKPAGLVVHPAYKNTTGTLLDWLRERDPAARFGILGRLDKPTSGIVLAAKDAGTYVVMQRAWRSTEKDYLAVAHGRVEPERGDIDLRIGADPADRRRRMASTTTGAPSLTHYERLDYIDLEDVDGETIGRSLLRCRLLTGRRHQIRVHLAACGWPIVGDTLYGHRPARPASPTLPAPPADLPARHALHAWRIAFAHPSTGERMRLEAPVPPELRVLFGRFDSASYVASL